MAAMAHHGETGEGALWIGIASGAAENIRLSVMKSNENPARIEVTAETDQVIFTFAIASTDELVNVLRFLEVTHGCPLEDRVQIRFGTFYQRPLRMVRDAAHDDGGYLLDAAIKGVAGGDDGFHFRLSDSLASNLIVVLRQVVDALREAR